MGRAIAVAGLVFVLSGCGDGGNSADVAATDTTVDETSTTVDQCQVVAGEAVESLMVLLDRVEVNFGDLDDAASEEVFTDIGVRIGESCGTRAGDAISEILVALAGDSPSRAPVAQSFIEGIIGTLCDLEYDLTTNAKVVCTAS